VTDDDDDDDGMVRFRRVTVACRTDASTSAGWCECYYTIDERTIENSSVPIERFGADAVLFLARRFPTATRPEATWWVDRGVFTAPPV
jgi:hypothetical protein